MKKNDSVMIRKFAAVENPVARTPAARDYFPEGLNPGVSVPVDHTIEGDLLHDVVIGEAMTAYRRRRNGVEMPGIFQSTPVVSIEEEEGRSVVRTANSVYEVIPLSPEDDGLPI